MSVIEINNLEMPELAPFVALRDSNLKDDVEGELLVAESPKVISSALDAGLMPVSLLCERKHIEGDAAGIIGRMPGIPVYTGERDVLSKLTGYTLTRGVLCAMKRPDLPSAAKLLGGARRICVIYDVCDSTNIGVIFRTAAALGYDGVLVSSTSCSPFNRRAVRVSMGAVFKIPWTFEMDILGALEGAGFESVSMALTDKSVFLQDFTVEKEKKYALLLGSEGYGLPGDIIRGSTHVVKIPMHYSIDSLNVGAAAAIALWHFIF